MEEWLGAPKVDNYEGLNLRDLPINYAFVVANTSYDEAGVYSVSDDCFNCPYILEQRLFAGQKASWMVDISSSKTYKIMNSGEFKYFAKSYKSGLLCLTRPTLNEYGVYELDIGGCNFRTKVEPVNTYLPLLLCSFFVVVACLIYCLGKCLERKNNPKKDEALRLNVSEASERIPSLQILRGILTLLIIFTTTGAGGYPILNNEWGGCIAADYLVMAFAWSVGVNIPIDKALGTMSKCSAICHIVKKSWILVLVSIVIDSTVLLMEERPDVATIWNLFGKIGVSYFVVASIYTLTLQKLEVKSKNFFYKAISTLTSLLWCWIFAGFLIAMLIIMTSALVSFNCQATASIDNVRAEYSNIITEVSRNCNNSLTVAVNDLLLGLPRSMVYINSFRGYSYGVMGLVSTTLCTMFGLNAGMIYIHYENSNDRVKLWLMSTTLFMTAGLAFGSASIFLDLNLWPIATLHVVTANTLYAFTMIYIITEKLTKSSILESCGLTSLSVLGGHLLFSKSIPFDFNYNESTPNNHFTYLLQNLWTVFLWILIGVYLAKHKLKFSI